MTPKLPVNLDSLLHLRTIESERVEYKAGRPVSLRYHSRLRKYRLASKGKAWLNKRPS
jgi:hypothetical protein